MQKGARKKTLQKAPPDQERPHQWKKLYKTVAKTGKIRAYICGTSKQQLKKHLIVEVTQARSSKYIEIIDNILLSLREKNITKAQALALKEELCSLYP